MITVKNFTKKYHQTGKSRIIFSDFSLSIQNGQHVGLFGENGTGKSTLLNAIAGFDKDFYGTVSVSTKRIGYVHQDVSETLAPWFTCEKNILLAREYHHLSEETGRNLLKRLSHALHLSFSLELSPSYISGGQRQIVALLRAFMLEPDVFIFDEPFAHLDSRKRKELIGVFNDFFGCSTMIISSHRGEEILPLITRAVLLQGNPPRIGRDIHAVDNAYRFRESVLSINVPILEDACI